MKLSIFLPSSYPWADLLRVAEHTERSGWEGVWFPDHFMPTEGEPSWPILECWATLAGFAAVVPRVRLGALVCGNTYRHPAVLANTAVAADHVSGGRVVLGIGAGWQENEHAAYGIHFGSTGARLDRLEEACQVIRGLRDGDRFTFHGQHYHLEGASMHPKPVGRLPLLVGGGGERRTIPIAARYADEWNAWGTVETSRIKPGFSTTLVSESVATLASCADPRRRCWRCAVHGCHRILSRTGSRSWRAAWSSCVTHLAAMQWLAWTSSSCRLSGRCLPTRRSPSSTS